MKKHGTSIYLQRDDTFCFLVRNKQNDTVHKQGMYLPLGGKVENGESIDACAIREVIEEAGVHMRTLQFKAVHYIRQLDDDPHHDDWIIFMYVCNDFSGIPQAGNEGHLDWVSLEGTAHKPLYGSDRKHLLWLHRYAFHVAEFTYDGFTHTDTKLMYAAPA